MWWTMQLTAGCVHSPQTATCTRRRNTATEDIVRRRHRHVVLPDAHKNTVVSAFNAHAISPMSCTCDTNVNHNIRHEDTWKWRHFDSFFVTWCQQNADAVSQEQYDPRYHTQDMYAHSYHHDRYGMQRHDNDVQAGNWYQGAMRSDPDDTGCMCTCRLHTHRTSSPCPAPAPTPFQQSPTIRFVCTVWGFDTCIGTVCIVQTAVAVLADRKGVAVGVGAVLLSLYEVVCRKHII